MRRFLQGLLLLLLLSCVTGCSSSAPQSSPHKELKLDSFQNEEGVFQFSELPLGISLEEAKEKVYIHYPFPGYSEGSWEFYNSIEPTYIYGEGKTSSTSSAQMEFDNGKLIRVRFKFTTDPDYEDPVIAQLTQTHYEDMMPKLEDLYGPPDSTEEEGETVVHIWLGEEDTMLRLSHGPGKGREAESMILSLAMGQAANWKEI